MTTLNTIRTLLILLGCLSFSGNLVAQDDTWTFEAGTFEYAGETVTVTSEELAQHARWLRGLRPDAGRADELSAVWARAVRTRSAQIAGIEVDEKDFARWMEDQHAPLREEWMVDGRVDAIRFNQFLKRRGYARDIETYEAQCRLEYLGEKFVAREFPEEEPTDDDLRAHYRRLQTTYVLSALTIAPETLSERYVVVPDRESEKFKELFRKWYESLPDRRKIIYDDVERPAVSCEAVFVLFGYHTIDSFKKWFETPLPTGRSMQELTADIEPKPFDRAKIFQRWVAFRRVHYPKIAEAAPDGADDRASFEVVEDHLIREWKTIRYLGRVYRELAEREKNGEVLDLKKVAEDIGLPYRHYPLSPMRVLVNDIDNNFELRGDHPYSMRRTAPGKLYSYTTLADNPSNDYYANGVVDQPGYHASIWRVLASEEMRVQPADVVMERAWPDFERALEWKNAEVLFGYFAKRYLEMLKAWVEEADGQLEKPASKAEAQERSRRLSREARKATFDEAVKSAGAIGRVLGPFYLRPGRKRGRNAIQDGPIGQRVHNFLEFEWDRISGGESTDLEKGDVLPDATSESRRLHVVLRVDDVIRPTSSRYESDPTGRERARAALEAERRNARLRAIRTAYAWPNVALKFSIKTENEQLQRVMSAELFGAPNGEPNEEGR